MKKVMLELPDNVVDSLDAKAKIEERSRAAVIRLALGEVADRFARDYAQDLETYRISKSKKRKKRA